MGGIEQQLSNTGDGDGNDQFSGNTQAVSGGAIAAAPILLQGAADIAGQALGPLKGALSNQFSMDPAQMAQGLKGKSGMPGLPAAAGAGEAAVGGEAAAGAGAAAVGGEAAAAGGVAELLPLLLL